MRQFLSLLLLAACGQVAPETALQLAQLDPLTADPGQISVALHMPPGLAPQPDGARLELAASAGSESLRETFALHPQQTSDAPKTARGQTLVLALTPTDAQKMRDWQAKVAGWKAQGISGEGSLGLAVDGCRLGGGPEPMAQAAAFVRLRTDAPFLPLIPPTPLQQILGKTALQDLTPCHGPQ